jgi:hypothetical protein
MLIFIIILLLVVYFFYYNNTEKFLLYPPFWNMPTRNTRNMSYDLRGDVSLWPWLTGPRRYRRFRYNNYSCPYYNNFNYGRLPYYY